MTYLTFLTVVLFSLLALQGNDAFAQAKKADSKSEPKKLEKPTQPPPGAPKPPGDEKLDISDLEQKYWAPKDSDFSVVQNRTYTKDKRFSASLIAGPGLNDVYSEGLHYGLIGNYFWSERYGVQLTMINSELDESGSVSAFKELSGGGTSPDYNRMKGEQSVGFNWVPFYAKMSLLGDKIIYFDMMLTPVLGQLSYEQQVRDGLSSSTQSAFTYGFDITQLFFLQRNFAVRVDLRNRWFKEEILAFQTGVRQRDKASNYSTLTFGGTFFF